MSNKDIIINYVKNNIKEGKYKPGTKIMSESMMIEYLGVSRYCVREALDELCKNNIIEKRKGSGSFIKNHIEKKYIVISVNEAIFINEVGRHYRNLTKAFQEKITLEGYIPVIHLEPDSKDFSYGYTNEKDISQTIKVPINEIAGFISINGNVDAYEILEKYNIPIIVINKSHGIKYPSVNIDYSYYYSNVSRLITQNNFKNIYIFHYRMHDLIIESENLIHYAMDRYFADNFNYLDIPLSNKNNIITKTIEKHIKNLNTAPDCIVFLDNTLYINALPLFPKYEKIFKNTKIITHSNNDEIFPQEYKICTLTYKTENFINTGMDLLLKLIKKECPIRTSYDIRCQIIGEEMLK